MTGLGADALDLGPVEYGTAARTGDWFEASISFPGMAAHVQTSRDFTCLELVGHPCAEIAVLLVSELVTNSVRHSRSAGPDGKITVTVSGTSSEVKVEVADAGGETLPMVREDIGLDDEGGRGLRLVAAMSDEWGHLLVDDGCVTCFVIKARL